MAKKIHTSIKIFLVIFIFSCTVLFAQNTVQASVLEDVVKNEERSLLDDINSVTDTVYNQARNGHLNFGSITLKKISPTRANITATTQAYHVCPEVILDIYVDKYNPKTETWEQIRNWEYSEKNTQHVTKEIEFIVLSGYYYSVRGVHTCIHGNVVETGRTETDGLYIGSTDKPVD